jgi:hypothetical protein
MPFRLDSPCWKDGWLKTGVRSGVTGGRELADDRGEFSDELDSDVGRFGFESLEDVEMRPDKPMNSSGRAVEVMMMLV